VDDSELWYTLVCLDVWIQEGVPLDPQERDEELTEAACKEFDGELCNANCILSGKSSVDGENRAKWKKGCGKDKNGQETDTKLYVNHDEASAKQFCS